MLISDVVSHLRSSFRKKLMHLHAHAQVLVKSTFCISQGSAVTILRWSGQFYTTLMPNFLRLPCTKNYENRSIFDWVIKKIKRVTFFCLTVYISDIYRWYLSDIYPKFLYENIGYFYIFIYWHIFRIFHDSYIKMTLVILNYWF